MLIGQFGMALGELWWTEDLAADCAEDGVYEVFLVSVPLNAPGASGLHRTPWPSSRNLRARAIGANADRRPRPAQACGSPGRAAIGRSRQPARSSCRPVTGEVVFVDCQNKTRQERLEGIPEVPLGP